MVNQCEFLSEHSSNRDYPFVFVFVFVSRLDLPDLFRPTIGRSFTRRISKQALEPHFLSPSSNIEAPNTTCASLAMV